MEKISSPRERRKWSLGLGQHLKGTSPDVRTESGSSWEISEFSIFLKINKSREQFLLRLTLFTLVHAWILLDAKKGKLVRHIYYHIYLERCDFFNKEEFTAKG